MDWVATFLRIAWQLCRGLGGNFPADWVAEFRGIRSGAGDLQKLTDTALTPALCREGNALHAGLGTLGIAVGVEQGERRRGAAPATAVARYGDGYGGPTYAK
jgi:hypothetical protein